MNSHQYYLDVSEYVMTQHILKIPSPVPSPLSHPHEIYSPYAGPLVVEIDGVQLSPYSHIDNGSQMPYLDLYAFELEGEEGESLEEIPEEDSRLEVENFQSLDGFKIEEKSVSEELGYSQEFFPEIEPSKLNLKYFKYFLGNLERQKNSEEEIRSFVSEYLTPENYEEHDMSSINTEDMVRIAEHNLRPVGCISWLQRRSKVIKFKNKKSRRSWRKKINYDCRKKVADSRLRVKGKFVTREQACNILGVDEASDESIKSLLDLKFNQSR